jgi:hypothetical protein
VSDFVEARYALQVLERARELTTATARDLTLTLAKDLSPPIIPTQPTRTPRARAVQAIRALALSFNHQRWPPRACWDTAQYTLEEWCREAAS